MTLMYSWSLRTKYKSISFIIMAFKATITYFIALRKVIHNNKNAGNVWRQCNTTHKGAEMELKMILGRSIQQMQATPGFLIHF